MFYLSKEDWSPRFGNTFFTVTLETRTIHTSPASLAASISASASTSSPNTTGTKNNNYWEGNNAFPAVYFNLKIQCCRDEYILPRRYSQFRRLYDELCANPPQPSTSSEHEQDKLQIPPKTCFFQSIDDEFLDVRQDELYCFIANILKRPGYANHPAVRAFLGLDRFSTELS
jgi:hypothetical protein